jgi:hypothetical protein
LRKTERGDIIDLITRFSNLQMRGALFEKYT